jgi:hypothetical protein
MQTFLPYANFEKSAKILDYRRLGKQRVEAWQLMLCLEDPWAIKIRNERISKGLIKNTPLRTTWRKHPAAQMWSKSIEVLHSYYNYMVKEWISRGYNNTMPFAPALNEKKPSWLGNQNFHSSHRSALLFKNFEYYSQFGWIEIPKLDYIWPNV